MTRLLARFEGAVRAMRREESGATAAEFALVVPTFLLLVFGTINVGMAMSAVIQIHYAAKKAARCLSTDVTASCTPGNIDSVAKGYYDGPGITGLTFTATAPSCGNQVTGTGSYDLLTGFSSTAVTITANACYPNI
jgi:Flp pilus assembly protein TadG